MIVHNSIKKLWIFISEFFHHQLHSHHRFRRCNYKIMTWLKLKVCRTDKISVQFALTWYFGDDGLQENENESQNKYKNYLFSTIIHRVIDQYIKFNHIYVSHQWQKEFVVKICSNSLSWGYLVWLVVKFQFYDVKFLCILEISS